MELLPRGPTLQLAGGQPLQRALRGRKRVQGASGVDERPEVQLLRGAILMQGGLPVSSDYRIRAVASPLEVDVVGPNLLDELELVDQVGAVGVEDQTTLGILAVTPAQGGVEMQSERDTSAHDAVQIVVERPPRG
jgi:hypothetical protein